MIYIYTIYILYMLHIYIQIQIYSFHQFEIKRSFAKNIFGGKITLDNVDEDQSNMLIEILELNKDTKPRV